MPSTKKCSSSVSGRSEITVVGHAEGRGQCSNRDQEDQQFPPQSHPYSAPQQADLLLLLLLRVKGEYVRKATLGRRSYYISDGNSVQLHTLEQSAPPPPLRDNGALLI